MAYSKEDHEEWSEFQPRDPGITALVQQLAAYGLLVSEVESLIKCMLGNKLLELRAEEYGYDESAISVLEGLPPTRKRRH